ncbi:hypothetical protein [Kitasatospora sp. NPDC057500]
MRFSDGVEAPFTVKALYRGGEPAGKAAVTAAAPFGDPKARTRAEYA